MHDIVEEHDLVLGANRLIVDIVRAVLGEPSAGPPVAILIDPDEVQWRQAASFDGGIVLVTGDPEADVAVVAVQRGVHAVVDVAELEDGLRHAVAAVRNGEAVLTPRQVRVVVDALRRSGMPADGVKMSKREGEILESIAAGHSVKQTAKALGITPKTVENLQGRLYRKLQVRNRAQAVARAHELGLLDGDLDAQAGVGGLSS
jgi:DNA-binding NarL/FixJ family response regulator